MRQGKGVTKVDELVQVAAARTGTGELLPTPENMASLFRVPLPACLQTNKQTKTQSPPPRVSKQDAVPAVLGNCIRSHR